MRQLTNFRLSIQASNILAYLAKKTHSSKTAVLEQALSFYAKQKISKSPLADLAGTISEKDADLMMATVTSDKRSKKREINL